MNMLLSFRNQKNEKYSISSKMTDSYLRETFYLRPHLQILGHALHEKGLQRQKSADPLLSSQERRAAVVSRINRWSNAAFVPPSIYIGFRLFVLLKSRSGQVSSISRRVRRTVVSSGDSPGRTDPSASRPARPRPTSPLRRAPPRPDPPVICPGLRFYFRTCLA